MPLRRKARKGEESPDSGASYQPSRFRWTITSVDHAPTKWCSTRSYSIVTVCSDRCRCCCSSAQGSGAARHPHRLESSRPRDRCLFWRTAHRSAGMLGPRPLLPGTGCAGKSVKRPRKRRHGQWRSPEAVSKLFKLV